MNKPKEHVSVFGRHRFFFMIVIVLAVSGFLVAISMGLYISSGTAQLDLSRPGLEAVREQVIDNQDVEGFSADGPINEASLDRFDERFSEQLDRLETIDGYSNDVLSAEALKIDQESSEARE